MSLGQTLGDASMIEQFLKNKDHRRDNKRKHESDDQQCQEDDVQQCQDDNEHSQDDYHGSGDMSDLDVALSRTLGSVKRILKP